MQAAPPPAGPPQGQSFAPPPVMGAQPGGFVPNGIPPAAGPPQGMTADNAALIAQMAGTAPQQ